MNDFHELKSIKGLYNYIKSNFYLELFSLFILFCFAVIVTKGHTIAWGLLPLFYAFANNKNLLKKTTFNDIKIGILLFLILFISNFLLLYNFQSNQVNIAYSDYHYYAKVASFFNQTGAENYLTSKNILFNDLHLNQISTQYRFFETWILAFLFETVPFSDLIILQLFFMPLVYFISAYSIYKNSEKIKLNWVKIVISLVFLFIFGDVFFEKLLLSGLYVSTNCLISIPKLTIFFCLFVNFFASQLKKETQHNSILFIALLPILIQVTFSIYLFVFGFMMFHYKYFIKNKKLTISILASTVYYLLFYAYNTHQYNEIFKMNSFQTVKTPIEYIRRVVSILYHFMAKRIFIFGMVSLILIYFTDFKNRIPYLRIVLLSICILIPGLLTYAFFPATPNSPQFMTNVFIPSLVSSTFIIWIYCIPNLTIKYFYFNLFLMISLSIASCYNQVNKNRFFGSSTLKEDKYILEAQNLLKNCNNKIGITYFSQDFKQRNSGMVTDSFNQYGTNFLLTLGANYDVVSLSILNEKATDYTTTLNKYYSSIALYQRKNGLQDETIQENFYHKFKFEFLISNLTRIGLPSYIQKEVVAFCYNPITKVYCYKLKKNKVD